MNEVAVEPSNTAGEFLTDKAVQYLKIYNADIEWLDYIGELYALLLRKTKSEIEAKQRVKQHISFTILAPMEDPSIIKEPYHRLLFGCSSFARFNDKDWESELRSIWEHDAKIEKYRNQLLSMGIIHPIEYVPMTRQALNWLMERVEDNQAKDSVRMKMQNLVFAYGGATICNIFLKPEYQTKINKIPNWRTGYFFERLIYEVYKPDQMLKIKEHELNKVDSKLVKKIRINN